MQEERVVKKPVDEWLLRWGERFWGFALGVAVTLISYKAGSITLGVAVFFAILAIDFAYTMLSRWKESGGR